MAEIIEFPSSDRRLKELILYVLNKMGPLTKEHLSAVLWKIDSTAFLKTGKSITGCQYWKAP